MNNAFKLSIAIAVILSFYAGYFIGNREATNSYEQKYFQNWRTGYFDSDIKPLEIYDYPTRRDDIAYYGGYIFRRMENNTTQLNISVRRLYYIEKSEAGLFKGIERMKYIKNQNDSLHDVTFCPPRINESGVGICYY